VRAGPPSRSPSWARSLSTFESGVRAADLVLAQEATAVLAFTDQRRSGWSGG